MLEALFAIPLYKSGVAPYIALPVVSVILTLLPFIFISILSFKNKPRIALIILSIPLLLPPEYSLITGMPRGFVTGLFFAGTGCITLFYSKSNVAFLFAGFIAVIAFSVNSNSALLSFFYLLLLFVENRKNIKFYYLSAAGVIAGALIHFLIVRFYITHPFYDLHGFQLDYDFSLIKEGFTELNEFFNFTAPVFWTRGSLALLIFPLISFILLKRKEFERGIVILLIPIVIILSLGINKTHDGTASIFFSHARIFLALPLLIALSTSFLPEVKTNYFYFYLLIPLLFFINKTFSLKEVITERTKPSSDHVVSISKVHDLLSECSSIKKLCDRYKIQLVIISNHWNYDSYNYGCRACEENFPNTLRPVYERRTWRLLEDEKRVYENILIIDTDNDLSAANNKIIKAEGFPGFYVLQNNQKYTMDLLKDLGIKCRQYK